MIKSLVDVTQELRDSYDDGSYGKLFYNNLYHALSNMESESERYNSIIFLSDMNYIKSKKPNELDSKFAERDLVFLRELLNSYND